MFPCAQDNRNEKGLEEVLEGRIDWHVGVLFLCPVRRRGEDTVIRKRGEIHCLGGLKDHLERGCWFVVLESIEARKEVVVRIYSNIGDTKRHGSDGSSTPSSGKVQDTYLWC